jgi:hypothetical protein
MYLADEDYQSTIQFGGYEDYYLRSPVDGLTWIPLSDNSMLWDVNVDGFRVGTSDYIRNKKAAGYYIEYNSTAILDSGTSLMYVPSELFHPIMNLILDDKAHIYLQKAYWATCDLSQYQSLYLLIGDTYFELPP